MARKVYQAHLGFYDTIVASPSQASALAAWGSQQNLFRIGLARLAEDPLAIKTALAKPGVVLRRPAGSAIAFSEHPPLPTVPETEQQKPSSLAKPRSPAPKNRSRR